MQITYLEESVLTKLDQAEFYELHGTPGRISHMVVDGAVIINSNLPATEIKRIEGQYREGTEVNRKHQLCNLMKIIEEEEVGSVDGLEKEISKLRFEIDQELQSPCTEK